MFLLIPIILVIWAYLSPGRLNIVDEIKSFDERFISLRKAALKDLTESEIYVRMFCQSLPILPDSMSSKRKDFVENAKSIKGIFAHLNCYLSIIDFSLLEHIIEQFGSERLKEDMSCYAQEMRNFRKRTTLSEILLKFASDDDPPVDFSRLTVKTDLDAKVATLENLSKKNFASRFLLSHLAFFLSDTRVGSLLVTWFVPTVVGTFIRLEIGKKDVSFLINGILKLSLDGEQLYPSLSITEVEQIIIPDDIVFMYYSCRLGYQPFTSTTSCMVR